MPSLEDFCQELWDGTKREIEVPKEKVTELSSGWYKSKYNLPHKGSHGAMRNGRLHAHDMGDHYSVHLDRVDPQGHEFGHLIQDAPLVLFLWTGVKGARDIAKEDKKELAAMNQSILPMLGIGIALLALGVIISAEQAFVLGLIVVAAVIGLVAVGIIFNWKAVKNRGMEGAYLNAIIGIVAIVMAIVIYLWPDFAIGLLIFALMMWTLASGLFLVFGRGDKLLFDEHSLVPLTMGLISLIFALLLLFSPYKGLDLMFTLGGLLVAMIGLVQIISSFMVYRAVRSNKKAASK